MPLHCRGTCRAVRELVTSLPATTWRGAVRNSLPPLHPLLQAAEPWAYLQQQVQLHACITSPDTWALPKWSRLESEHRDRQSADRQLRVSAGPSSLDIVSTVGQVQVSSPLLPHEARTWRGDLRSSPCWAPDGSRLALARLVEQQWSVEVQVLEVSAKQLMRLPPVVLQTSTPHEVHAHSLSWSPCSTQLAVCQRCCRPLPLGRGGYKVWFCNQQGRENLSQTFKAHAADSVSATTASVQWAPDSSAVTLITTGRVNYILSSAGDAFSYVLIMQINTAVWAPHLEGCGHLLLLSSQRNLYSAAAARRPTKRLRKLECQPFYLVCGVRHVALALSPSHVMLFTMQAGPVLQLEIDLHFDAPTAHRAKAVSLCLSPAGRYLALLTEERLHVVSTCSGKTLGVRTLDPKSRWFTASAFGPIGPHSAAWHSAHRLSAYGTSESTGRVQIDVCFQVDRT